MSKSRIIKKFTLNFLFILIMGFVFISCNQEPTQINGYTVEFSGNAETVSGSTKSLDAPYDKNVTLTENGFTRTGYTFSKWNTEADGSGTDYQDKATVKNLTTGKNITLYAQWTPNTYTIHFNGNDEAVTGTMESINATYDSDVILSPNAFNRSDYVFNGWYSDPNGAGTRFGNKASVRNLANGGEVTLYAQWIQNAYTIEFNTNAEEVSGTTESMTVLKGQSATLTLNGFSRTGYSFSKWNTEADGTGNEHGDGESVSDLTEEESITLYAQWTPNTYTIMFSANGGQGSTGSKYATYGTSVTLTANGFTKEGYTFGHWSTNANGTGDVFTDGQTVNNLISSGSIILFAIWTPNNYTIQFDPNGGEGTTESINAVYNENVSLTEKKFTKTGYTFSKWNTKEEGDGDSYEDKQTVSNLVTVSDGSITLYAQWTPNEYIIVFNSNGGEGTTASVHATYDTNVTLTPNGFIRTGYTFSKWNTEANGEGTPYEDKDDTVSNLVTSGTITLYAIWKPNTYSIQFDSNGGDGTTDLVSAIYGINVSLTPNGFTRTGYTFSKWNTKANGEGTSYENGENVINLVPSGTITLYAIWKPNKYTIQFDANGGQGTTGSVTVTYGVDVTLTANGFSRTGYTFSKWNTKENGGGKSYDNEQTVSNLVPSGIFTLYAIWTPNEYTIQFDSNGGEGNTESITATYGVNVTLNPNGFTRTGYTFSKWNTKENGGGNSYDNEQTVSNLVPSGIITLYAIWKPNKYTIQFNSNGGTGTTESVTATYGVDVILTANGFTRIGYEFSKWNTEADGSGTDYKDKATVKNLATEGDVTLYAIWTANTYTIQFDANGGEGTTESVTAAYGVYVKLTENKFTRTGYTFSHWSTDANGTGDVFADGQENIINLVTSGTITLYAQWTENSYTIVFNSNGGNGNIDSINVNYSKNIVLPTNTFTKAGYTFTNWATNANGNGYTYNDNQTVSKLVTSGTITLYAQWSQNTYTIVFNSNGGEGTTKSVTATYGVNVTLTANGFTRTGYTFSKWNTKANGEGTSYENGENVVNLAASGTVTLYAQWTANTYTIQFGSNGGEETTTSITATYGVNVKLTENKFTRTGYTFSKWNTKANGEGTSYENGENVINLVTSGTITLYAIWTPNKYTIVFNSNIGSGTTESVTVAYDEEVVLMSKFSKTGYTLSHWTTQSDGNGESYNYGDSVSKLATGGIFNLYAQWTPTNYTITYELNGGTASNPASYTIETATFDLINPERSGYVFSGWTWEGQNTPSKNVTIPQGSTGNKVYIANWVADSAEPEI